MSADAGNQHCLCLHEPFSACYIAVTLWS